MFQYRNQLDHAEILNNCIFVKTILMLLVIMYHSCVYWTGTWWDAPPSIDSSVLGIFARWLNSFHIYAFALVSGYIFAYKRLKGSYRNYGLFIKNKARRLLIPYVFVVVVWVIPISRRLFGFESEQMIKKYLLGNNPDQLWFLWMLFDVFVIVWPLWNLIIKSSVLCWGMAIIFYSIGVICNRAFPNIFCVWTAFEFMPLFCMGIRMRVKEERSEKQVIWRIPWLIWLIFDILIFMATNLLIKQTGTVMQILRLGMFFVLHMIGAVMIFVILQILANKIQWKEGKGIKAFSVYSMPMYLFHQQIVYFMIILLDGKVSPFINFMANFVITLIVSLLISIFLMHWRITRWLLGG